MLASIMSAIDHEWVPNDIMKVANLSFSIYLKSQKKTANMEMHDSAVPKVTWNSDLMLGGAAGGT